jgi:solute carrier family 45 protein 1/2/4
LAVVSSISLAFSIAITCFFVAKEKYRPPGGKIFDEKLSFDSFFSMTELVSKLVEGVPKQVMYIYIIQLMAWMGWYPYLLYASTYVADICKSPCPAYIQAITDHLKTGQRMLVVYMITSERAYLPIQPPEWEHSLF